MCSLTAGRPSKPSGCRSRRCRTRTSKSSDAGTSTSRSRESFARGSFTPTSYGTWRCSRLARAADLSGHQGRNAVPRRRERVVGGMGTSARGAARRGATGSSQSCANAGARRRLDCPRRCTSPRCGRRATESSSGWRCTRAHARPSRPWGCGSSRRPSRRGGSAPRWPLAKPRAEAVARRVSAETCSTRPERASRLSPDRLGSTRKRKPRWGYPSAQFTKDLFARSGRRSFRSTATRVCACRRCTSMARRTVPPAVPSSARLPLARMTGASSCSRASALPPRRGSRAGGAARVAFPRALMQQPRRSRRNPCGAREPVAQRMYRLSMRPVVWSVAATIAPVLPGASGVVP